MNPVIVTKLVWTYQKRAKYNMSNILCEKIVLNKLNGMAAKTIVKITILPFAENSTDEKAEMITSQ